MGLQMLLWGVFGPWFGVITDKYGGHIAIISAFIFYAAGIFFLYTGPNTGIFFQISLGVLVGTYSIKFFKTLYFCFCYLRYLSLISV